MAPRGASGAGVRHGICHEAGRSDTPKPNCRRTGYLAEIINLRQARKRLERDKAQQAAAQNRAVHGQSRVERLRQQMEALRRDQHLAGVRREQD